MRKLFCIYFLFCLTTPLFSQGFLKTSGQQIVNENGENVLLRGIGFGGWMLQEGYMLRIYNEGQQHKIKDRIVDVIGAEKTGEFYNAWLANHVRKIDIDSLKSWGFNSVRLPMHYNLFTLPIEDEPVAGNHTWLTKGFQMTDSLLNWCEANKMYLILDLHAAPGGQGTDSNISDRDPEKPSLWDSNLNMHKTITLWKKLAERYKDEPWIGGYDIINEPNWGFTDYEIDKNGLNEKVNAPLRKLMIDITNAIREVDTNHIIIVEGNGWGNNYSGIFPLWDDNMVISFHKYWNYNDQNSIQNALKMREEQNAPIWLGETGENSNVWFTQAIELVESHNIGWAWWPLKKLGFNNPLEIKFTPEYEKLLAYWYGEGDKPSNEEAYKTLMSLADGSKLENCFYHKDVIDAMFRQVYSLETKPFKEHQLSSSLSINAVDYDLGRNSYAYWDTDTANYYISTGGSRTGWNLGRSYRNDGVDIYKEENGDGYYVGETKEGEWLQYSFESITEGKYSIEVEVASIVDTAQFILKINKSEIEKPVQVPNTKGYENWVRIKAPAVTLKNGDNNLMILIGQGGFNLKSIKFTKL